MCPIIKSCSSTAWSQHVTLLQSLKYSEICVHGQFNRLPPCPFKENVKFFWQPCSLSFCKAEWILFEAGSSSPPHAKCLECAVLPRQGPGRMCQGRPRKHQHWRSWPEIHRTAMRSPPPDTHTSRDKPNAAPSQRLQEQAMSMTRPNQSSQLLMQSNGLHESRWFLSSQT